MPEGDYTIVNQVTKAYLAINTRRDSATDKDVTGVCDVFLTSSIKMSLSYCLL